MSKAAQVDIVLNQATAAIVCCYLEHMNKALDKGMQTSLVGAAFFLQAELVSLINDVQAALKSV
jgi:hypothetical protein